MLRVGGISVTLKKEGNGMFYITGKPVGMKINKRPEAYNVLKEIQVSEPALVSDSDSEDNDSIESSERNKGGNNNKDRETCNEEHTSNALLMKIPTDVTKRTKTKNSPKKNSKTTQKSDQDNKSDWTKSILWRHTTSSIT